MKRKTILYMLLSFVGSHASAIYHAGQGKTVNSEDQIFSIWCCPFSAEKSNKNGKTEEVANLSNESAERDRGPFRYVDTAYGLFPAITGLKRGYGKHQMPMGFFASRGKRYPPEHDMEWDPRVRFFE